MSDEDTRRAQGMAALEAGYRWVRGALSLQGIRVCWVDGETGHAGGIMDGDDRVRPATYTLTRDDVPDFSDPTGATLGTLMKQARNAWGDQTICVWTDTDDGPWYAEPGGYSIEAPTEIDCWIAVRAATPKED